MNPDTWEWCQTHNHPMTTPDPGGPPYCWTGYVWDEVNECDKTPSITVHLDFPKTGHQPEKDQ